MKKCFYCLLALCTLASAGNATAQHAPPAAAQTQAAAAPEAAHQFDFMLGQWQVDVHPKISGLAAMIHGTPKIVGTWKAWRVLDGMGIEDELRIVDASGNPLTLNRGLRVYAQDESRWQVSGIDAYHGRTSVSSGRMQGAEMQLDGRYDATQGKPTLTRTRYFDIGADSFRMQQDRSNDDGATWDEAVLSIDAKRVAAAAPAE